MRDLFDEDRSEFIDPFDEVDESEWNDAFDNYQDDAETFAIYNYPLIYPVMGLAGECGEVHEVVKRLVRDKAFKVGSNPEEFVSEEDKQKIAHELGDVLWYLTAIASDLGLRLSDIANQNLEKLTDRQLRDVIQGSGDTR
jgi:NTP pyrophosphatase (non-canonical NTP hydrolase)